MAGGAGGAGCGCGRGERGTRGALACAGAGALVLAYNAAGGLLFLALEGGREPPRAAPLRAAAVERLWALTEDLNILYKDNWTALAARELLDFQRALLRAPPAPPVDRWTYSASFLYALTLITTIGPGRLSARSVWGRVAAALYAALGVPLVTLYLATLGAALARRYRAGYARLRARAPPPAPFEAPFTAALNARVLRPRCSAHVRVPVPLSLLPAAAYVGLGALMFRATERWSLLDGCYFAFATLATIGLGDLRPGQYASTISPAAEDAAVGVCCAYILIGIAIVAMCFNLVQEDASAWVRSLGERKGRTAGRGAVVAAKAPAGVAGATGGAAS